MVAPAHLIGFFVMPIGTAITLWVLFRKIQTAEFIHYLQLAIIWTLLAVVLDYLFIVQTLHSENYYKPDVYLYYALTALLPITVGWVKTHVPIKPRS